MKVTLLLADAAQAVQGKLYILGGGWSIIGPAPAPSAIALKIEVPWDLANRRHRFELTLLDSDGHAVTIGEQAVRIAGEFEAGRPAGLAPGTPLDVPLAISIAPLSLAPGSRYVWRLSINGQSEEHWQVTFTTRRADGTRVPED